MHFTTLFLAAAAASASLAAAQTGTTLPTPTTVSSPSGTSACDAQLILDTCVSQRQPQVSACAGNDWSCLCQQYGALLTCYDNCPGDPQRFGVSQFQVQNCAAASAAGTTTLMVASSTSSSSSSGSGSLTATRSSTATADSTASGSGSAASSTGAGTGAPPLAVEMTGGLLAVIAAGFGLFL